MILRDLLPDRLARMTGSSRSAKHHLRRTLRYDRVRKRVRPSERVGPPFGRVSPEDALSGDLVEHGPRGAPQALRVQYRLPGIAISPYRLGFVARGEDQTVWCLVSLLPSDLRFFELYPEGEECSNPAGQRVVRRGWGLAVADVLEGSGPGTYQVLSQSPANTRH